MKEKLNMNTISATSFVHYCTEKFRWSDLSKDVIMDVGCKEDAYCGKSILAEFPSVKEIIAIDKDPKLIHKLKSNAPARIECVVADIEKRETLQPYEGRMTKVLSFQSFHLIRDIEEGFRNVHHLLIPGGEAAFVFGIETFVYEWLLKMSRWKRYALETYNTVDFYKNKLASSYKEKAEKVGFEVVDCSVVKREMVFPSDDICKIALLKMTEKTFRIPLDHQKEFKEESFQEFVKINGRNKKGKPLSRFKELSLLLVKPAEGSRSKI